jgi:hypothetical protein
MKYKEKSNFHQGSTGIINVPKKEHESDAYSLLQKAL